MVFNDFMLILYALEGATVHCSLCGILMETSSSFNCIHAVVLFTLCWVVWSLNLSIATTFLSSVTSLGHATSSGMKQVEELRTILTVADQDIDRLRTSEMTLGSESLFEFTGLRWDQYAINDGVLMGSCWLRLGIEITKSLWCLDYLHLVCTSPPHSPPTPPPPPPHSQSSK